MRYRGFFIEITEAADLEREDKDGNTVVCGGSYYRVCSDEDGENLIDDFCAAVEFELPDGSSENAELFAKEMVDSEYKEYCRIRDEQDFCGISMSEGI